MTSPLMIVMAGGSASGKTTIARRLAECDAVLCVSHDRYYRDAPDPAAYNFDHPEALETSLLVEHVMALKDGRRASLPIYGFDGHKRAPHVDVVEPKPIVLVEGILTLEDQRLAALADLSVFVDAAADVRLARRVRRDLAERGRDPGAVIQRYLTQVRPMHITYVEPSRSVADLVLDGEAPVGDSTDVLRDAIVRLRPELAALIG